MYQRDGATLLVESGFSRNMCDQLSGEYASLHELLLNAGHYDYCKAATRACRRLSQNSTQTSATAARY